MNDIMRMIKDDNLEIFQQQFDNTCSIKISIRKMQVNAVLVKLKKLPSVMVKYDYSL